MTAGSQNVVFEQQHDKIPAFKKELRSFELSRAQLSLDVEWRAACTMATSRYFGVWAEFCPCRFTATSSPDSANQVSPTTARDLLATHRMICLLNKLPQTKLFAIAASIIMNSFSGEFNRNVTGGRLQRPSRWPAKQTLNP
jgi:hypothetical protein